MLIPPLALLYANRNFCQVVARCIISIHREQRVVAMMLTCLCEYSGKERFMTLTMQEKLHVGREVAL